MALETRASKSMKFSVSSDWVNLIWSLEVCLSVFVGACTLFDDYVNISDYIASNYWMIVKSELERMLKESVMAYFKVPLRNFTGRADIPVEIRTRHFSNTSEKYYRLI